MKNFDEYVKGNFEELKKQAQAHYPGMVSSDVYDKLKDMFENACKKKTIMQTQQRRQLRVSAVSSAQSGMFML